MTQQDKELIEEIRTSTSYTKIEAKSLFKIRNDYHKENSLSPLRSNCFCAEQTRKTFIKDFYNWYDKLNSNNE